jgi:hypothetical protein
MYTEEFSVPSVNSVRVTKSSKTKWEELYHALENWRHCEILARKPQKKCPHGTETYEDNIKKETGSE